MKWWHKLWSWFGRDRKVKPKRRPLPADPVHRISAILAVLHDHDIPARSLGSRSVILSIEAAEDVASRIADLALFEERGVL